MHHLVRYHNVEGMGRYQSRSRKLRVTGREAMFRRMAATPFHAESHGRPANSQRGRLVASRSAPLWTLWYRRDMVAADALADEKSNYGVEEEFISDRESRVDLLTASGFVVRNDLSDRDNIAQKNLKGCYSPTPSHLKHYCSNMVVLYL